MRAGPLANLRVIEVSAFVAAPLAGMTLAQLGADVIRVDPLGGAADRNRWPLTKDGASLYWAGLNKSKRSLEVDFRSDEGRRLIHELVASSPQGTGVVLTNAVGRDWLSYDVLRTHCPDLIHVQIEGRRDGSPAVDYTVNAEVGFPMVTGPAGHADPVNHVLPAWDIACGLYAALGVAAAARSREATGRGDHIRVALADVAMSMAGSLGFLAEAQINNVDRQRIGNYLYGGFARDFTCSDGGRVMVVALTARHWRDLVCVTELEGPVTALEVALGCDFTVEDDRFEYREALAGLFQRWFSQRTRAEVSRALDTTALVWAPYRSFGEALQDLRDSPRLNPLMNLIDQPGVGEHLAPGLPMTFSEVTGSAEPAPLLGSDTRAVLSEAGFSQERVDGLVRARVVHDRPSPELDATHR